MLPKLTLSYPFSPSSYPQACSRQPTRRPHLQAGQLNAIMSDSSWNTSYTCSASPFEPPSDPSSLFPPSGISSRPQESYPSPASSMSSPSRVAQQELNNTHDQMLSNTQDQSHDYYSSSYADSHVDHDGRTLPNRLSRPEYKGQRRRDGMQNFYPRNSSAFSPVSIPFLISSCLTFLDSATTPHMKPQRLDLNRPLALVKINIVLTLRQLPL